MPEKLTGKEVRALPKKDKKVITFYLTVDEALEFTYLVKSKKETTQDYLRNIVLSKINK